MRKKGKRKTGRQKISWAALLLILSLVGVGCGKDGRTEAPAQVERTEKTPKMGALSYGYFYEEEGISVSSKRRFLYSDWTPVEFDYICMDPTCGHLSESCSARTIQDEASRYRDFSVVYQGRLIILHAYSQLEINESSETLQEWKHIYQTDVYEADPDGSNRRKVAVFSGAIGTPVITHAAVLADGKLYFGGPSAETDITTQDTQGGEMTTESWIIDAVYCLDLNDYTLETFAVTEKRTGLGFMYQLYEYDGMIYAIISSSQEDCAVWYRIDPGAGVCEEVAYFDSNAARFEGAVGNEVYYWYEDSEKTLYVRNAAAGSKEREFMTVTGEDMSGNAFILDGQLLIMTDFLLEGEDRMAEYTVFDPAGKVLDTIRYDSYITFLDTVGDKVIYFKADFDFDWDVWWADKADLKNLTESGVRIGPFFGQKLDTLGD